ncbi:MAG: hypothetical protein KDB80_00640, partial [Planctomycetes bacterium]|nr:hypothetical protein [Planctomycetota bacterium]
RGPAVAGRRVMTSSSAESPATPPIQRDEERGRVPLSEVMLAMDVVDMLRHERALVEQELREDERRVAFIARVREIYESQGIEVSDEVVAEGVDALLEDRFRYEPPKRTFAVRLAEVYVERVLWAKRAAIAVVLLVVVGLAYWIPHRIQLSRAIAGFEYRWGELEDRADDLRQRSSMLSRAIQSAAAIEGPAIAASLLADAGRRLGTAGAALESIEESLTHAPDANEYPERREALDALVSQHESEFELVLVDLAAVDRGLESLRSLRDLGSDIEQATTPLASVAIDEDEQRVVDGLRAAALAAVDAGDREAASGHIDRLRQQVGQIVGAYRDRARIDAELVHLAGRIDAMSTDADTTAELTELRTTARDRLANGDLAGAEDTAARLTELLDLLELEYELRIVTDARSGVWRYDPSRKGARNHYIIVEAFGRHGNALRLSIENEETGKAERVRKFGVRVPESVYERIKADKLDNGIIDARIFGHKRRGSRVVDYEFEVAGGMITRW